MNWFLKKMLMEDRELKHAIYVLTALLIHVDNFPYFMARLFSSVYNSDPSLRYSILIMTLQGRCRALECNYVVPNILQTRKGKCL